MYFKYNQKLYDLLTVPLSRNTFTTNIIPLQQVIELAKANLLSLEMILVMDLDNIYYSNKIKRRFLSLLFLCYLFEGVSLNTWNIASSSSIFCNCSQSLNPGTTYFLTFLQYLFSPLCVPDLIVLFGPIKSPLKGP